MALAMRDGGARGLRLGLVTACLFLAAAMLSDLAARQASGLEALWPGNAIVLGLLIARVRGRPSLIAIGAGGALASIVFHVVRGDPPSQTILFAIANVTESLGAFLLLRRFGRIGDIFDRVSDVLALVAACALASLASASIGAIGLALANGAPLTTAWFNWYVSGLLSQLVVAPAVVILAQLADQRRMRSIAARTLAEIVLMLGTVAAVSAAVFLISTVPMLFLIPPVVLLATFRLRALGAVGAVGLVAVISAYATSVGSGPIAAALPDPAMRLLLLQMFLACCFLTALPASAMLTERDARAEEARLLADRFRAVVENIGEVIFRVDPRGRWSYLNPAWETLIGRPIAATLGRDWLECVEAAERDELVARTAPVLAGKVEAERHAVRFTTETGPRWMELFVQCLRGPAGELAGATGTLRDIDDRKRLEEHVVTAKRRAEQRAREATLLASTDELTGIANRRAFVRQLEREIAGAAEFGWPLAVAMFDVDHFKRVNDRHGHAVGDKVLQLIAARAAAAVRGGDLVGRLGGEEFGILMPGATAEDAAIVAERLREAVEWPGEGDDPLPGVTVSIGIAAREANHDAPGLLGAADTALYAAKHAGRNRVQIAA